MNRNPQLRVVFFRTDSGKEPVQDWLEKFGQSDQDKIETDIRTVAENWLSILPTSRIKKLLPEKDLWEIRCRISDGKRIVRILCAITDNRLILLHSFIKKSQKTPRKELRLARKRYEIWKRRMTS